MVELKLKTMNRNQIIKRANRIVWNTIFRRTLLMALAGINLLGIAHLITTINNF